jgi:molybdate transport system ATP-binding protein
MSLHVDIRHVAGELHLDVSLDLGRGLTALVGPSGAGKTTVLNVIAGVVKPDYGVVTLDADVLANTGQGIWRAPHRRQVGYVFQEPRLFPHLTVRQNIGYGRWFRRHAAASVGTPDIVALLNLGALLHRYPSRLSGGEKQRVALARALLAAPRLLLLDEPLSAVDQRHRQEILPYLDRVRVQFAIPTIYVTHTWAEIADRADQVVTLNEGKVSGRADGG